MSMGVPQASCWSDRLDGKYVSQQHGKTNECYDLGTAKQKCMEASDCGAIATQSNVSPPDKDLFFRVALGAL